MMQDSSFATRDRGSTKVVKSLAEYEAAISDEYAPLALETVDNSIPFRSTLASRSLGWMRMSRVHASSSFSGYRKAKSHPDRREELVLMLVEEGWFSVVQHGRKTECGANTLVLMDCDAAMDAVQIGATSALAFKMPKVILRAHYANIDSAYATAVNAFDGCPAILRDLMLSVWRNHEKLTPEDLAHLPSSILNLAGLVFLQGDQARRETSSMAVHYERIEQAIIANLSDPDLSPTKVAGELGISKSYLFAVTNWGGSTFRRMVMEHRLERCRKALADPAEAHRSITDIALGWGFQNPSHFSRCFVGRYDATPSGYREQIRAALADKHLSA